MSASAFTLVAGPLNGGAAQSVAVPIPAVPLRSLLVVAAGVIGGAGAVGAGATATVSGTPMAETLTKVSAAPGAASTVAGHLWYGRTTQALPAAGSVTVQFPGTPQQSVIAVGIIRYWDLRVDPPVFGVVTALNIAQNPTLNLTTAPDVWDRVVGLFIARNRISEMVPGTGFVARVNNYGPTPYPAMLLQDADGRTTAPVPATTIGNAYNVGIAFGVRGVYRPPDVLDWSQWDGTSEQPLMPRYWNGTTEVVVDATIP